jgi:hypothetical protein
VSSPGGYDAAIPERGESLLTIAKREAARRMLYSKFYRGEVLKSEYEEVVVSVEEEVDEEAEGGTRKKKRQREEEEGECEEHQKKKTKKKKKGKELEGGRVSGLGKRVVV